MVGIRKGEGTMGSIGHRSSLFAMLLLGCANAQVSAQSSDVVVKAATSDGRPVHGGELLTVTAHVPAGAFSSGYVDPLGLGSNGFRQTLSRWAYDCPSGRTCFSGALSIDLRLPPGSHEIPVTLIDGEGRERVFKAPFRSQPPHDTDNDGLPDGWESQHLLNPGSASGDDGAEGDPDGDGDVNLKEYLLDTFPRGRYRQYFAEGSSGARQESWACVDLFQPELKQTSYRVRFVGDGGRALSSTGYFSMAAGVCGLSSYAYLADRVVSVVIESDQPLVAERYFERGSSAVRTQAAASLPTASSEWHFADGVSAGAFDAFLLTFNPNDAPVEAEFTYYRRSGEEPIRRTRVLPPGVRTTVWVSQDDPEVSGKDMAVSIRAGAPILVERAWRKDPPGRSAFHDLVSGGATAPATTWLFPHVAISTRASAAWATSFVIANPNVDQTAIVEATLYGAGGPPSTMRFEVGALSRETLPFEQLHQLRAVTGTVSMELRSMNGVPIVADRTLESLRPEGEWRQSASGVAEAGVRWALAQSWSWLDGGVTIVNPSDVDATVSVKSVYVYGTYDTAGEETNTLVVPARRTRTVSYTNGVEGTGGPFLQNPRSLIFTSTPDAQGRVAPIVVERVAHPTIDGNNAHVSTLIANRVR
jgi:hypothetical protein